MVSCSQFACALLGEEEFEFLDGADKDVTRSSGSKMMSGESLLGVRCKV